MDHKRTNVCHVEQFLILTLLTDMHRDGPTPERQCEQILAIYPILKGQKPNTKNIIPPRGASSERSSHHSPAEQHPRQQQSADKGGDLIDFGQHDADPPAQKQAKTVSENPPAKDAHNDSTAEIQSMLSETGSPASGGPLIDFHQDMNTSLGAGLKRADTAESSDEFVDAHE